MDEYLFLVMAKLKADRLKLEREQRAAVVWASERDPEFRTADERHLSRSSWSESEHNWRMQS